MKNYCAHCGLPSKNDIDKFCCLGCQFAYQTINNLGLGRYYQTRFLNEQNQALKPEEYSENQLGQEAKNIWESKFNIDEFIKIEGENSYSISLMIENLHCAACIWLIENVLKKQIEVQKARINMTSKRLHLQWSASAGDSQKENQDNLKENVKENSKENITKPDISNQAHIVGNRLISLVSSLGYRLIPFDEEFLKAEEKKYDNKLLKALCVAGFAAGNVMLISVALWASSSLQMGIATRNLLYWVSALIALPAIIYSGQIFVISAFNSVKNKQINMDVPIAVAIFLTSIISIFEAINKGEHAYFDSVIMLIFFLLIGRYLDFSARKKAFGIVGDLMILSGTSATIIDKGRNKIIASKNLKKDMVLNVAMGEKIAADGLIIEGQGEIDTSIITGESMPKRFFIGDEVFAGMINLGSAIKVKITKAKGQTLLDKIAQMVEEIENSKTNYTKIADKVAKYYTPVVHLLAFATFLLWCLVFQIGWHQSLLNAATVLIITCPCALALAVPVVQIVVAGRLLKQGILLKNGLSLEKLNKIDTIIFDKTGTLTNPAPTLIKSNIAGDFDLTWQLASSMATKSKHILSKALLNSFKGQLLDLSVQEIVSMGLKSSYQGKEMRLGRLEFVSENYWQNDQKNLENQSLKNQENEQNQLQIYFSYQNQISIFTFSNNLKIDSKEIIKKLGNYHLIILSGDRESAVKKIATELEIKEFYFEQTPDQKLSLLKKLKSQNKNILMIGDGINDAPSLMLADVSMSPALASDISKNIADIIFQGDKLQPVLETIKSAKKSNKIIKQNLSLALIYNFIAIPFAVLGFVVPLFAALAMSFSSIVVVLNALRIKRC